MTQTIFIAHRINTLELLKEVPGDIGLEIDLRAYGNEIILHHDAFQMGINFRDYLKSAQNPLFVLNIKEAGIEERAIQIIREHGNSEFFLLDVEFPFLYRAARKGVRNIAVRYSEDESLETVLKYKGMVDWVWIDTINRLPLDEAIIDKLQGFKSCLVCPARWGRPGDIKKYRDLFMRWNWWPTAVMTSLDHLIDWKV